MTKVEWKDGHWHNDKGFVICPDWTLMELDEKIERQHQALAETKAVRDEVAKKQRLTNFLVTHQGRPAIDLAEKLLQIFDITIKSDNV